ncbi:ribonuclease E/G [Phenylobacterium sp.]|uniref:ribonuclease E/G n=1 Tax=Phenylobacterium sp. TaxID=1871053 RepID=UPI002E36102B|nr:ribonuclease E/G [Phenylobacterium sp.]HEX2560033.1 ribonuclease E/G [Phenylobacterium sp.]
MSERRLYLDKGVGEQRGVVTLDGRPERLLIARDGEAQALQVGARHRARVRKVEPQLGSAFLELAGGAEAMLDFKPDARPVQGASLEVEIRAEPRRGKLALARALGPSDGPPQLLAPPPGLKAQLTAFAPGVKVTEGPSAREMADEAEAEALASVHPLPGGGSVAIEPTRALTAVDIDVGERQGQETKRVARQANLAALGAAARLLRLKGLGGIVVFDLVGRGHDGAALTEAARAAFRPDNPGVAIGPISRFGTLELLIPRRTRPIAEILCTEDGRLTPRSLAQRLIREAEREAAADPGGRLLLACAPAVAQAAEPLVEALTGRIGARVELASDPGLKEDDLRVRRR